MTHRLSFAAIVVAAVLAGGVDVATAQSVVNGPYYATPSWDQTMPASTRFVVLANFNSQAVLDRETGLVWQRALNESVLDRTSVSRCHNAATGGRYGWRLPSVAEMTSLFDPTVNTVPSLPVGHPFTGFTGSPLFLWTSTRDPSYAPAKAPGRVSVFDILNSNGVEFSTYSTEDQSVLKSQFLCVRGGAGGDGN